MQKVLVLDSTYDNIAEAVEQIFEIFPVDLKDKKVCIKVNCVAPMSPDEFAFVTDHRLLKAVVAKVESLGPKQLIIGDSVGTASFGRTDETFEATYQKEAAGKYYKNLSKNVMLTEIERPRKRTMAILRDVMEADVYISLPKLKPHWLTRITAAVKNNYGVFVGLQKAWFHYVSLTEEEFTRGMIQSYALRPPDLVIGDAVIVQHGYSPATNEQTHSNKIMASTDGVALDTVFCEMIGYQLEDVPTLTIAREQGLGETDLSKIEVIGDLTLPEPWHLPAKPVCSFEYNWELNGTTGRGYVLERFRERVAARPIIDTALCAACETCADEPLCVKNCPVGALSGDRGKIVCEKDECLVCTSCMEWCPARAINMLPPDPEILESLIQNEEAHKKQLAPLRCL